MNKNRHAKRAREGDNSMKRLIWLAVIAGIILSIPVIALANRDSDNVEEILSGLIDQADQESYDIIDTAVDSVDTETNMIYTLDVTPGTYIIYAESGDNIDNLDLAVFLEEDYDNGDDPFAVDDLDNSTPAVQFDVYEDTTIVALVSGVDFARRQDSGYFCILFCKERDSEDDGGDHHGK
jgi:hypothetical protein